MVHAQGLALQEAMNMPASRILLCAVLVLILMSGCSGTSRRSRDTDGKVDRYLALWRSKSGADQETAIRWFATKYIRKGMPRSQLDALLGLPGGGLPVDEYVPPYGPKIGRGPGFGIGVVCMPTGDGEVVDRAWILDGVPRLPGEIRPQDLPPDPDMIGYE